MQILRHDAKIYGTGLDVVPGRDLARTLVGRVVDECDGEALGPDSTGVGLRIGGALEPTHADTPEVAAGDEDDARLVSGLPELTGQGLGALPIPERADLYGEA